MNQPYGGALVELFVSSARAEQLRLEGEKLPTVILSDRNICDLELLAHGAFSPLSTFLGERDYESVCRSMRLSDGTLWPMPIMLAIDDDLQVTPGDSVGLRDPSDELLAVMRIAEVFAYDANEEAKLVLGTVDEKHPGVRAIRAQGSRYISGSLEVLQVKSGNDFPELRRTPQEVRTEIERRGWRRVVAFQTRNPLHRAHEELTKRAAKQIDGGLLLHPVVGVTKPGDVDHPVRVRCYKALVENHYDGNEVVLSLLPLAMRMGGPREALWHAIVRRNYGATHFIVGRDHAGPGNDSNGNPFYGPYDAQDLLREHQEEIGVSMVPFQLMVYLPDENRYVPIDEVPEGAKTANISGTQVREDYLAKGRPLPEWFSRPEVAAILAEANRG